MQIVVWNSRGGKWNAFWTHYFGPLVGGNQEDMLGLLVESGWAPWVTPGNVKRDSVYARNWNKNWFNNTADRASAFCQGVAANRGKSGAYWVPWVRNLNALKTNTRCSMGAVTAAGKRRFSSPTRLAEESEAFLFYRPVFRMQIGQPGSGGGLISPEFSVYLVHLISGNPNAAQAQMNALIRAVGPNIPQNSGALIVGDLNINILNNPVPFNLPNGWRLLRTNGPTHDGGSELDWGLLYDPTNNFGAAAAYLVAQTFNLSGGGFNTSDHAVLRYHIPL